MENHLGVEVMSVSLKESQAENHFVYDIGVKKRIDECLEELRRTLARRKLSEVCFDWFWFRKSWNEKFRDFCPEMLTKLPELLEADGHVVLPFCEAMVKSLAISKIEKLYRVKFLTRESNGSSLWKGTQFIPDEFMPLYGKEAAQEKTYCGVSLQDARQWDARDPVWTSIVMRQLVEQFPPRRARRGKRKENARDLVPKR
jgi:hypothetical protein